ncbi:hypothetical protein C8J57DRAFT_1293094 [Mycena rebaudengoi]|nr:hypothetical protein C8J57DRAFT_1293094 [Mycena rebaudengoi]
MNDSPPPAYTPRPEVSQVNRNKVHFSDGAVRESQNAPRKAQRDAPARPLPPLPPQQAAFGRPSLIAGRVSPLHLHKKSQSAASPSVERPWKPPRPDETTTSRWDPTAQGHPQFRHRGQEFAPSSSPQTYFGQRAHDTGHFQAPTPNPMKVVGNAYPERRAAATVDPNAFYNPAVSAQLSRLPHPRSNHINAPRGGQAGRNF